MRAPRARAPRRADRDRALPARALLLLDEPTAQLDAANEAALSQTIERVSQECALLVVAHRFSTIPSADRIVIIEDGKVARAGTHEERLASSSYYRRLARTSALDDDIGRARTTIA